MDFFYETLQEAFAHSAKATYSFHRNSYLILDSNFLQCLFVCVDTLHPSQQFFSCVRKCYGLPGLNLY